MTIPVIRQLLHQHPDLKVTFVSNTFFRPLFQHIDRLEFYPAELKGVHKGFGGLYRLYKELKVRYSFDAVADLHNVLRTQVIRKFFLISSTPVKVIDKGRKGKKELTRKEDKVLKQLPTTFERYAEVFKQLGLPIRLNDPLPALAVSNDDTKSFSQLKDQGYKLVGIAPFAQHPEKMYPADKMKEVISMLLGNEKVRIFLFGGGAAENSILQSWENELPGVTSMSGKMSFEKELQHIAQLDTMVSMDSANMHLASLYGVPVVSIWGGTHPFAGFYGWGQSMDNAVQIALYCRPCSVFGNKTCYRGDLACMHELSPLAVHQQILKVLKLN